MHEHKIINSIKYHIACRIQSGQPWHIDELIACMSAIVFPFFEEKLIHSSNGSVQPLNEELKKYFKNKIKQKPLISRLSFDSLIDFFAAEFCTKTPLHKKTECVSNVIGIKSIGEDGIVSFKANSEVFKTMLSYNKKYANLYCYGIESYQPALLIEPAKAKFEHPKANSLGAQSEKKSVKKKDSARKKPISDDEQNLNIFWQTEIVSDNYTKCMPYVWKLKISNKTYNDFKEKLKIVFNNKNICNSRTTRKLIKDHCEKLLVYIAEWYKWEYESNKKNAFDELGIKEYAKEIWESLDKWHNYRYKNDSEKNPYIHLHSIYALGGLQLKYINNNDGARFVDAFEAVYKQEEFNTIFDKFKKAVTGLSSAFSSSLMEDEGSWRHFIRDMQDNYKALYRDEDQENDLVKKLYQLLEKSKNRAAQDKFNIRYRAWKSPNNFYIHRILEMSECSINEYNEIPADIISRTRINTIWKIEPSCVFNLRFKVGNNWQFDHKFVPYRGKDYRSSTWQSKFELPDLTDEGTSSAVEIDYIGQDGRHNHIPSINFPEDGYVEFRKVGKFEWKDKKSYRTLSDKAAVLFDADKWSAKDSTILHTINNFAWVEFDDKTTLVSVSSPKEKTLYNASERYRIEPTEDSIHPITKLSYVNIENNKVKLNCENEEIDVYLLKHPISFYKVDADNASETNATKIIGTNSEETIKYRLPNDSDFKKDYKNGGGVTDLGYMIFKITLSNGQKKIIHGYILPDTATITRHLESDRGHVRYSNCEQPIGDLYSDDSSSRDYIPINIQEGDYYITINVARPFTNRRDRFRGDLIDDKNNAIPIRFADQYQVRIMDENGVTRKAVDKDCRHRLMSKLNEAILENNEKEIKIDDQFRYRAYTKSIDHKTGIGYYVDSGKSVNKDNLHFKFLSLNDNVLTDITLVEKEKTNGAQKTRYLTLDNIPKLEGIIIQSLYDKDGKRVYPLRYYKPRFISSGQSKVDDNTRITRKIRRLCGWVKDIESCIAEDTFKHFEIACNCGCYFPSLDRLLALTYYPSCKRSKRCIGNVEVDACKIILEAKIADKEERMARFYIGYCDYCANNGLRINYSELWRMAEELCCDWLLIPRDIWEIITNNEEGNKQRVINLLKHRPIEFYKVLLDNYWDLNWKPKRGGGVKNDDDKIAYNFMNYILTVTEDKNRPTQPAVFPSREAIVKEIDRLNKA